MPLRRINAVLWASLLCIALGFIELIVDIASGEPSRDRNPNAGTLIFIGVFVAVIGQVLFHMAIKIEALEARLAKRHDGDGN